MLSIACKRILCRQFVIRVFKALQADYQSSQVQTWLLSPQAPMISPVLYANRAQPVIDSPITAIFQAGLVAMKSPYPIVERVQAAKQKALRQRSKGPSTGLEVCQLLYGEYLTSPISRHPLRCSTTRLATPALNALPNLPSPNPPPKSAISRAPATRQPATDSFQPSSIKAIPVSEIVSCHYDEVLKPVIKRKIQQRRAVFCTGFEQVFRNGEAVNTSVRRRSDISSGVFRDCYDIIKFNSQTLLEYCRANFLAISDLDFLYSQSVQLQSLQYPISCVTVIPASYPVLIGQLQAILSFSLLRVLSWPSSCLISCLYILLYVTYLARSQSTSALESTFAPTFQSFASSVSFCSLCCSNCDYSSLTLEICLLSQLAILLVPLSCSIRQA